MIRTDAGGEPVASVQPTSLFLSIRDQQRRVLTSQRSQEWYTPAWCIDAVRRVLGTIELDPASSDEANQVVQATRYYTLADDGLRLPWRAATLFLNPPYNGKAASWCQKAIEQYEAGALGSGILLVFAKLGYTWFEELWNQYPTCFVRQRIHFTRPSSASPDYVAASSADAGDDDSVDRSGAAKHASAFVYFGPNRDAFRAVFAAYGRVIYPEGAQQ